MDGLWMDFRFGMYLYNLLGGCMVKSKVDWKL